MKTISSKLSYKDKWVEFFVDQVDFGHNEIHSYSYLKRADGVHLVLINEKKEVFLIKQYRYPVKKYQWEIPGGSIDKDDEGLASAALREFKEETGINFKQYPKLKSLGTWYPSSSIGPEKVTAFFTLVSTNQSKITNKKIGDGDEDILEGKFFSLAKVLKMIDDNELDDMITIMLVQLVARKLKI